MSTATVIFFIAIVIIVALAFTSCQDKGGGRPEERHGEGQDPSGQGRT